ncbi:hypothetical protein [Corynebacterium sp. CCM 9204]|uniref:hypothetical protein n=1 Tax=Corynebacterium sp. CCM 9204 TaxID=3057616 RepID=UPI0035252BE3
MTTRTEKTTPGEASAAPGSAPPLIDTRPLRGAARARVYASARKHDLMCAIRGIYLRSDTVDGSDEAKWRAYAVALLHRYPKAVAMAETAASLHGFPLADAAREPSLQYPRRTTFPSCGRVRFRSAPTVARADRVRVETAWGPVWVTSPLQTAIDVARYGSVEDALVVFDHCLRERVFTLDDIVSRLLALGPVHRLARVVRVLVVVNGASESPRETLVRYRLWVLGFPLPLVQATVRDRGGVFVARTDFCFPDHGVVVEYDGRPKYGVVDEPGEFDGLSGDDLVGARVAKTLRTRDALMGEQRRQRRLEALGFRVVRVNWETFRGGEWTDHLRRLLELEAPAVACRGVPAWRHPKVVVDAARGSVASLIVRLLGVTPGVPMRWTQ